MYAVTQPVDPSHRVLFNVTFGIPLAQWQRLGRDRDVIHLHLLRRAESEALDSSFRLELSHVTKIYV